jgi:hypothetical protein
MDNIIPKFFLFQGERPAYTKKKKWLDIFTSLHLLTPSSKNLDKHVKGASSLKIYLACRIDKPFEPT